ncbi:copper chaperone PCu(A)C [Aquabacterium sp. OR-4]|uniref:copper chaperone PCu(A)C n=1 Tax=Aquabacterium sp. OR-4 TaxID=2978127 RepID=UPI0021B4C6D7|nr:copper chaperone PCu(A)C [Aquabacterium sp. OR-4]MDT7838917.1 copper chaperone PCu(A)C [Aquabacterium sp. OR-4]
MLIRRRMLLQRSALGLGAALLPPLARACEFQAETLRVTHPYCHATEPGSTEAVVCMKFDEVIRSDRLVGASTPVARGADVAGALARPTVDFEIPEGQETWLHERGTWLRLTGLRGPLGVGRTYPLTLEFEHGGTLLAQLTVDFPVLRFR